MSDYKQLKEALLEAGELFEDDDFPAEYSSLAFKDTPSWGSIEWKRPQVSVCWVGVTGGQSPASQVDK